MAGRLVATPFAGKAPAGAAQIDWGLRAADGSRVSPGLYFARLEAPGRTVLARITVIDR